MKSDPIARVAVHVLQVNPRTRWVFLEITTAAGLIGVGEASLNGKEADVRAHMRTLAGDAFAMPHAAPTALPAPNGLVEAASVSALDQALWDVAGQRAGRSVADMLGGSVRNDVALYANINRRTRDRSPDGFAASARDALGAGFTAVKIAPFDEVAPGENRAGAVDRGLVRIATVRDAIGAGRDLLVDCHWRLTEAQAEAVIRFAAGQAVYWVECPLPETEDNLSALARLRRLANAHQVRLAGCEQGIGMAGFEMFLKAGAYDAMMPDVKYVGGLTEVMRLSERFADHGVAFSPHNPTGPVCHAASLHVCAAARHFDRLEVQFDETPLFAALVGGALPQPAGGASAIPRGAGLGVVLTPAILRDHADGAPLVIERA